MKKLLLTAFAALCGVTASNAQTMTGTVTTVPCNHDGVYAVTVSGLTAPISYTYYIGSSGTVVHSNVNSLTDQVTGFSASNYGYVQCYASDGVNSASVYNNYAMPFNVSTSATNPMCPNTTGTLSATSFSGTPGPFTYNWTNITTLANYMGNNIPAPIGQYTVAVTDQVTGCVVEASDSSFIYQSSNINLTYFTTPANCTNGTASVSASGGVLPYTYQWNTGANTTSITNLTQGVYTATVTDALGCAADNNWNAAYVQQSININVNPSITHATCVQNDGSAIAFGSGGLAPYSYLWSNGQNTQTLTAVPGGNYYTVIVTDANGCTGTGYATINATTPVNVTFTATPSSCTAPTGSASLTITGGTAPYATVWNTFSGTTTNTSLSGVTAGLYGFTITDAVGCVRSGIVNILPVSIINATMVASAVVCPATTGNVITAVSGTNPPFSYNWSNGSTATTLNGVSLGGYSCVITDALGCSVTRGSNLQASSPIMVGLTPSAATCKFNADGSVTATAIGGTAPYTYAWSNGQTGATATGLSYGNIWLAVTDANGCRSTDNTYVTYNAANTSCYCTITGKVYRDANSNCTIDGGENGIHNIMIHCSGIGYAFTDANGNYSFQVPTGTYTLTESVNSSYPLASCQSNAQIQSVTGSAGCVSTLNFANNVIPLHDLHIITTSNIPPIPGNAYHQKVIIENNGTLQESAVQIGYKIDGQLGSYTANPNLFTQNDAINFPNHYSVNSGFASLTPGTYADIDVTYNTPTNIPLGTLINFYDSTAHMAPINPTWLTDQTPWNNVQNYQQTVVGSFDPNFKEVTPQGIGAPGYIASKDSLLSYVIHFQNEGTYFAQNISVVDTLDSDLDWTTLHPGYSDHSYTTSVSENGVITFKFANVNLPWKSQYGDLMSSGLVTYTIKRKRNVAQGTQFKNTAAIYFDYNEPVITNTTVNTLNDLLSSVDEKTVLDNSDVVLYPNPASNDLSIAINSKENSKGNLSVLDITGKVLSAQDISLETGKNIVSKNTSELPSGIYFVQVKCNDSFITKKLVIIK
ncbi:MAG: T9SS type A sorting domain-containing protein [Bacteroidota bacterium]